MKPGIGSRIAACLAILLLLLVMAGFVASISKNTTGNIIFYVVSMLAGGVLSFITIKSVKALIRCWLKANSGQALSGRAGYARAMKAR